MNGEGEGVPSPDGEDRFGDLATRPLETRADVARWLLDIGRAVIAGTVDRRDANCAAFAAGQAIRTHALPEAAAEPEIEELAADLPDDPVELAKLESDLINGD